MKRLTAWIVMGSLMFSQGAAIAASAGEADWNVAMQAYRQEVLAPAAEPVVSVDTTSGGGGLWTHIAPLLLLADDDQLPEITKAEFVPWRQRRGPAYPDHKWRSFGRDVKELPATMWDDTKATFTDPVVLVGLLIAGAAGISINATGVDETVARQTAGRRQLSKSLDGIGGFFGSPAFHFPLAAAMYGTGLTTERTHLYESSKTLMNALAINGAVTQILKLCCTTASPNGDENGWPSGHTSSSFTLATVMYNTYGPWVGVPLLAFATFVGYERIDARNHDFSDVISGMVLGIVIAHAVSKNHKGKVFGFDVVPYVDPVNNAVGISLTKTW